jgi:hypothetical protein
MAEDGAFLTSVDWEPGHPSKLDADGGGGLLAARNRPYIDDGSSVSSVDSLALSFDNNSYLSSLSAQSRDQVKLPDIKDKYFGAEARVRFFSRLQFLKKQKNISCARSTKLPGSGKSVTGGTDEDVDVLYFDNEDKEEIDFPFSVSRPTSACIDTERYSSLDNSFVGDLDAESDDSVGEDPLGSASTDGRSVFSESSTMSPSNSSSTLGTFVSKYDNDFPNPSEKGFPRSISCPLSPRSKFINTCLSHKINPRSSLILRRKYEGSLDLQHLGMGDKLASLLSCCLADLPYVHELNIDNNNLTDIGVYDILKCLPQMPDLTTLNLSRNKIDLKAANALAEFVTMKNCNLQTLIMQQSDIDDYEGLRLLHCLRQNTSITSLNLSENKIGGVESMRISLSVPKSNAASVDINKSKLQQSQQPPSVQQQTCADAFAVYLSNSLCSLKSLNLSWNLLRLDCATVLCKCLGSNLSLTNLDLSYNTLGETGGESLGAALMENKRLERLNLSNCGISSSVCLCIVIGVIECASMRWLNVDSNPIGSDGAHALLLIPMSGRLLCLHASLI